MLFTKPPRVSHRTAQRDLVRGMKFLSTLSRVPEIRAALSDCGWRGCGYLEQAEAGVAIERLENIVPVLWVLAYRR
jgi:hypothetical protein